MKLFECGACGAWLDFESRVCENCGRSVGYAAERGRMVALDTTGEDGVFAEQGGEGRYRFCANDAHGACNWLIATDEPDVLCRCCRTNLVIPDLGDPVHVARWQAIELAKHRLFYSLIRLDLPVKTKIEDAQEGLGFKFLADWADARVMTGHEDGLITINIAEADDVEREIARNAMQEPYRTLLGHFRHEIGHYYWDRLVDHTDRLDGFRTLFGDERADYAGALSTHYAQGAPPDWRDRFVSAYASSHAWEDFAETFAHYLHMVDTLETAYAFGLRLRPKTRETPVEVTTIDFDPYRPTDFHTLLDAWKPLTRSMNAINRSMGQQDVYPFQIVPAVAEKLAFIDGVVRAPHAA
ncbi:zinc-binding metallopeptidase family protein [Prosthecomicrobium pneumaticum]|uniref:Zinc-ribbon domain-containing protein n=1 Tax=Prosthecomicrobium pneumaticum TaxID=81895 RepID=A0A7W9L3Y1_9HYPH|nr:putative zinc-binding metallopeptidase [Prosthecomicrobium pneumaticum]MBB5755017.1 hypothetical protein [Prosthecomicrobium pneumaticum]